ncbi:MAG: sigma-70 family RNA polymerase sigma factor [Acidobacteriaceae bacterium]|jgi:RNA polymerase sigma-70 factor (ECF subfamily)
MIKMITTTANTQPRPDAIDDNALVYAAKQGDTAAFEQLVRRHTAVILRVAMHILGSREDAEDVVQDAFLKAFRNLQQFEERARFSTWLTRIAVNEALMKLRGARRARTVSMDEEAEAGISLGDRIADWAPNPEQLYSRAQLKGILQEAFASLPDHQRTVFLLRDVEGLSIAETAELLGLSVPCVKTRLLHARLKLRQRLSECFARRARTGVSLRFQHILDESRAA